MDIQMNAEVSEFLSIAESWAQSNNALNNLAAKMANRGRFPVDGKAPESPLTDEGIAADTTAHFQVAPANISATAEAINDALGNAKMVAEYAAQIGLAKAIDKIRR